MTRPVAARAFLALWNGIDDPRLQAEYEAWHSFEHVPERVGLPGFLEAVRYREVASSLPAPAEADALDARLRGHDGAQGVAERGVGQPYWFTCYWLDDIAALDSEPYAHVFRTPTDWTARMRGHLTRFLRLPCALGGSHGVAGGGRVATLHLRSADAAALDAALAQLVREGHALSAQWGTYTETAAIPIANSAADAPQAGRDRVVLLQHLEAVAAQAAAQRLLVQLQGDAEAAGPAQAFELLTTTRREHLVGPTSVRQPPRDDLRIRFREGDLA